MTAAFLALFPTQLSFANQYGGLSQFLTIHGYDGETNNITSFSKIIHKVVDGRASNAF